MSLPEDGYRDEGGAGRIVSGLTRPNWICSAVKQTGVAVGDRSGSMDARKAADASAAIRDFITELADPVNKDGFEAAVIHFSEGARVVHPLTSATELNGNVKPLRGNGGTTNITAGLQAAAEIVAQVESLEEQHLRSVVILFTDGQHNTGPDPRPLARELREKADLVTVAFGSDADEALLKDLASSPQHFYRCKNGRQLRAFLAAVGATMSQTLGARQNATQALSQIERGGSRPS